MQKATKLTNDFAKTKNESMTCKESKRNQILDPYLDKISAVISITT